MKKIFIRSEMSQQEFDKLQCDKNTKFLFVNGKGLVAKSNYINELRKYARSLSYSHYTIVLNDQQKTNILY